MNRLPALATALALLPGGAAAAIDAFGWEGVAVRIVHPSAVAPEARFDISLEMDGTNLPAADAVAFFVTLRTSDTLLLGDADWAFDFHTADASAAAHFHAEGAALLTPRQAPTPGDPLHTWSLFDPRTQGSLFGDGYTFLWGCCQDRAVWTLRNLGLRGDTVVTLQLDDGGVFAAGPFAGHAAIALSAAPIPEPAAWLLLLAGLAGLAARGAGRRAAPGHICRNRWA